MEKARQEEEGEEAAVAGGVKTHAAYDGVVTRQVGFAMLAAKDLVRVQVDIVGEPHPGHRSSSGSLGGQCQSPI